MSANKIFLVAILFMLTIAFTLAGDNREALGFFFLMFFIIFVGVFSEARARDEEENAYNLRPTTRPYNVYYGDELHFSEEVITICLDKHLPYFSCLNAAAKERFLYRLNKFIRSKTFKIHDKQGFREMPILVSAAAIQLSFGLENYLLPQFRFIHIHPGEYFRSHHSFDVLAGNVSGQSINISWKHFLEGFKYPDDGQNVGLHEMAHAYYFQNFECEENKDHCFVTNFPGYNMNADKVFEQEQIAGNDLYSDYALKNFQEFWAESVEIFFEKPFNLYNLYPDLYAALKMVLRQDPLHNRVGLEG